LTNVEPAETLATVFVREFARLKRIIAAMGLSAPDAEDILHDVFVEASSGSVEYRGPKQSLGWLVRATLHRCTDEHRRRDRHRRAAKDALLRQAKNRRSSPAPDDTAIHAEEMGLMQQTLRDLDDSLCAPLVLRYYCDLNSTEVGEVLDLTPSTVRSRLRQARLILAQRLMRKGLRP